MEPGIKILWELSIARLRDFGIISIPRRDLCQYLGAADNELTLKHLAEMGYTDIDPEDGQITIGEDGPDLSVPELSEERIKCQDS